MTITWRHRLVILLLGLAAYWPVLRVGFIWDDHYTIESNSYLTRWTWANVRHDFSTGLFDDPRGLGSDFYRPLQTLSNRADYTLFGGLHPWGFHLTNLAFHIANALLLTELVIAIGCAPLVAWLVGCLFAVHPMIVSELLMISGRGEVMCLTFSLLALLSLLSDGVWRGFWAALAFLGALLTKEAGVMVPVQFGLILWFERQPLRRLNRLWVLALPLAAYFALYHRAMHGVLPPFEASLLLPFCAKAFPKIVLHYAALVFVPWPLYSDRLRYPHDPFWILYVIIFGAMPVVLWIKRQRIGLFCFAWFVLMLLPKTIMMITHGLMDDHWIYPSLLGILLPVALGAACLWENPDARIRWAARAGVGTLIVFWIFLTQLSISLRNTDEKLFRWSSRFSTLPMMKQNLGWLLLDQGRPLEAVAYLSDIDPERLNTVGVAQSVIRAYWQTGQKQQAIDLITGLLRLHTHDPTWTRPLDALQNALHEHRNS